MSITQRVNVKVFMYCYKSMQYCKMREEAICTYRKKAYWAFWYGVFKSGMYLST